MKVHRDIEQLPAFNKAVVTIGTFDGVHVGHQKIIDQLKLEAQTIGGESVIVTFHPHPRKVIQSSEQVKLLTTIDERIELLSANGIDHLVIVPFTRGFSELEPRDYIELFLQKHFHPAAVIIGYDHKFGRERKGDYTLLEEYSEKGYFRLTEIPQHVIRDISVSSTSIRNYLLNGEIEKANELLGYEFSFEGEVVKGDQRGRTIGYPTANIELTNDEKITPGNGVYAVTADCRLPTAVSPLTTHHSPLTHGMMNIGMRPTIAGTKRTIEVNLFDFNNDIYGKTLRITVKKFLRSEKKFSGLNELKDQLARDKEAAIFALQRSNS